MDNYNLVLNQLACRHSIFRKMLQINRDSDHISIAQVQLCPNKVDLELGQLMKSTEHGCHKYKRKTLTGHLMLGCGSIKVASCKGTQIPFEKGEGTL
jgi:hypothetical protein